MYARKEFNFKSELDQIDIVASQNKFDDALDRIQKLIARKDLNQEEKNSILEKVETVLIARNKANTPPIFYGNCFK